MKQPKQARNKRRGKGLKDSSKVTTARSDINKSQASKTRQMHAPSIPTNKTEVKEISDRKKHDKKRKSRAAVTSEMHPVEPSNLTLNKHDRKHQQKTAATMSKNPKLKQKLQEVLQQQQSLCNNVLSKKKRGNFTLRERMIGKLTAARFRYINEQIYTNAGKDMQKFFAKDSAAFKAYHSGYRQQVERWPLNPLDVVIEKVRKMPVNNVIADFGCGDAKLAQSVKQTVHSFDLLAENELVTACDMAHVPLENNTVDVVVFCLSLMGTNLQDYLLEANRVLKVGGVLKIAEVESRFDNIERFIKNLKSFGLKNFAKDLSHDLFYFLDFKKVKDVNRKKSLPAITLNPCLYKKR